ncbi:MAG: DNA translocase FtsK [Treponema sp.]|nr:DNA translocase FtsK [Treponema sp.]
MIHDEDEEIEDEEEKQEPVPERKYPVKISLEEEDETLPPPDYNNMDERAFTNARETLYSKEEVQTLDSDFFDIDMNTEPEEEELSDDLDDEDSYDDDDVASAIFEQISVQESQKPKSITSAAQAVFSDMEADIRREQPKTDSKQEVQITEEKSTDKNPIYTEKNEANVKSEAVQASGENNNDVMSLEPPIKENSLNPNAHHATNLTADELTDFFNAQQKQNTPVTTQIEGNTPKTNTATKKGPYVIPSDLLTAYKDDQYWIIDDETKQASINLKQTLAEFHIDADVIGIKKGPVVTMFELLPAPGVKLSKIVTLQDNIALSLAAQSVRIVAPIPGKQAVGIEVPNKNRSVVGFREIIEMNLPEWNKMAVPVVLGKDILGKAQLIDLVKTPHMLIAGATGSGKSVCVNSLILSILYKRSFKDVKLILVDPKVVELKLYNNIPHLLTPVITEPKKALQALQYCLCEMERRYALLDGLGVRDISSYNQRIKERNICTEKLPYIVVIIDEFADLMATSGKELESIVARLTAMSRAVGIHLVLATQRPSVNVITGLIKANIPTRIAFMVASRTDSNIIIDSTGAEKLLGRGDMLYASAVDPYPIRIQGTFVTDQEVEDVVNCVKQYGEPDYIDDEIFVDDDEDSNEDVDLFGNAIGEDPLYDQALEIVVQAGKASASYIQRRLKIGYNRAARLVEEMEERGIVGPANGSKPREVIHIP